LKGETTYHGLTHTMEQLHGQALVENQVREHKAKEDAYFEQMAKEAQATIEREDWG